MAIKILPNLCLCLLLAACAQAPVVGPKVNLAPIGTANTAMRQSIKNTRQQLVRSRSSLHRNQIKTEEGSVNLRAADQDLAKLLQE